MSLRQVLSIYNAERQLSEDDTALLNALRRLKDGERELLVQELSDKPQKKPGSERVYERCAQCGTTKGHRYHKDSGDDGYHEFQTPAKSTKKSPRRKATVADDDDELVLCQHVFDGGGTCKRPADHNIHHLKTDSLYHEFVAGKSDAQSAAGGL